MKLIPKGYVRLDEAFRQLEQLLNVTGRCDAVTGAPLGWNWEESSQEQRQHEWLQRVARRDFGEQALWQSIGGAGLPPLLTVWTKGRADTLERIDPAVFAGSEVSRHHSLATGHLISLNAPNSQPPLFVERDEWDQQKAAWMRELRPLSNKAEIDSERWLVSQFDQHGNSWKKADYRAAATEQFPRLGMRAFERAWKRAAPPDLRRPGRRPANPNRVT